MPRPTPKNEDKEEKVAPVEEAAPEAVAEKPVAKAKPKYTKATQRKIKELIGADVELDGSESEAEIDTIYESYEAEAAKNDESVPDVTPGVPNQLAPRFEKVMANNREIQFPIHFVAAVKGGFALYNERGQRISQAYGPEDHVDPSDPTSPKGILHINKAAAVNNARRRASRHPDELAQG